jgi:hypothetical protein
MSTKNRRPAQQPPGNAVQPPPQGPGRPAGSHNEQPITTVIQRSRCRKCGSTDRTDYWGKRIQNYAGIHDGREFRQIIRQRCRCRKCGQLRVDMEYV